MKDTVINIVLVAIPLLAAGLGYLFKEGRERKKILQNEVYKEKREMYQGFINLIIDGFSSVKRGIEPSTVDTVEVMYGFYKKYILYASPEVINAFSDYFQYIYNRTDEKDHKAHFNHLTKVMAAMRNDLGLSNTDLGDNGKRILRALITDFDEIM